MSSLVRHDMGEDVGRVLLDDELSVALFEALGEGRGFLGERVNDGRVMECGLVGFRVLKLGMALREVVDVVVLLVFFVVIELESLALQEAEGAVGFGLISHLTNI